MPHCKSRPHIQAHLVFADTQNLKEKPKELEFSLSKNDNKNLVIKELLLNLSNIDKSIIASHMNTSFGEYIRQLRKKSGLTLTQLSAKLELDSANLSKIENGKREFDEKRLEKLATVFQLDLNTVKTEFFSDLFAKKIYENNCSSEILTAAEEKVKYLKQKNLKQTELKLS